MYAVRQVVRIDCDVSRHARCVLVIKQSWREDICYIVINDEENVRSDGIQNGPVICQSTDTVKDARLGTSIASHGEQCVLKCVDTKKTCV